MLLAVSDNCTHKKEAVVDLFEAMYTYYSIMNKLLTFLLLSNGHGEDTVGAQLAQVLGGYSGLELRAYPTVGEGQAYREVGVALAGTHHALPSGGLLFHSWQLFLGDLRAGLLPKTVQQVWELGRLEPDVLITIGDAYALLLSARVRARRRFFVQTLVSAYHHQAKPKPNRMFMERFSSLELKLMHRFAEHVYVRDEATAKLLKDLNIQHVSALGNPMLDKVAQGQPIRRHQNKPVIALLPGSRAYKYRALEKMLDALRRLPFGTGLLAWTGGILPLFSGWTRYEGRGEGLKYIYRHENKEVFVYEGRFADILYSAQLALGTSGTANEQAAALGIPVVAFEVPPFYSAAFLSNQKRLLAEALSVVEANPQTVADALWTLYSERERYEKAAAAGRERMGATGGSAAIVADIMMRLGR